MRRGGDGAADPLGTVSGGKDASSLESGEQAEMGALHCVAGESLSCPVCLLNEVWGEGSDAGLGGCHRAEVQGGRF